MLTPSAGIGLVLLGALAAEYACHRWVWAPYFRLGLPSRLEPLPLAGRPKGEGRTSVVWWRAHEDEVFFGVVGRPQGLHGTARLVPAGRQLRLVVTWGPSWALLAVFLGVNLAVLGGPGLLWGLVLDAVALFGLELHLARILVGLRRALVEATQAAGPQATSPPGKK